MKNLIFGCAVAVLLGSMAGCKQEAAAPSNVAVQTPTQPADPNKPETPDPNKCYEGEVVYSHCPTFIWVSVKNGNIGNEAEYPFPEIREQKYLNAIIITNRNIATDVEPVFLLGKKIYFKLNTTVKDPYDCVGEGACYTLGMGHKPPKNVFCASSISLTKCN
jgi:hypothetical protein